LCEDARRVLDAARIPFEEVDITRDAGLEADYGTVIPVVEVGGRQVFEAGMDLLLLPSLLQNLV
jgi:hypothetical protein